MLGLPFLGLQAGGNLLALDGSLVVILISVLVFIFLLNRLLFKPISKVLDVRENLTLGARAEARLKAHQQEGLQLEYDSNIRQARGEIYRYLEQKRSEALAERSQLLEQARKESAEHVEQARSRISGEAAVARETLEGDAVNLAADISRAVLSEPLGGAVN